MSTLGIVFTQQSLAIELTERRHEQFGTEFSYYIYPIAGDVPGFGSAAGLGATVLNIADSDADFTGFNVEGDFNASGYTLLNLHLVPNQLIFDIGVYEYGVAFTRYKRGINSSKDDFIRPRELGDYVQAQVTYSYLQRHFEAYARVLNGDIDIVEVLDKNGNRFGVTDNEEKNIQLRTIGATFDNTDDRLDPRTGYRVELTLKGLKDAEPRRSEYFVTDYNFTGYLPFRKIDTLVFNFFRSDAHITKRSDVSRQTLTDKEGLGCAALPTNDPNRSNCLAAEADYINQIIEFNQFGSATNIGGTQRLRSFANHRFVAAHSVFWGIEYRYNITDERTPFNLYFAKGVRTGMQFAFFAEQGSVADRSSELFDTIKSSYGVGFRIILSGVIIRADISTGNEGTEFILFIDYPWKIFSIDSG